MLGVTAAVAVLAVRGADGEDNIGVYDDKLYGVTPSTVKVWDCNTNPSRRKEGVAELIPGVWDMVPAIHGITTGRPRPAFRQAPDALFSVRRWNRPGIFRGYFAIDLHDGGYGSTSSLGCLTMRPDDFIELVDYLYPALAWTRAKSWDDQMGYKAPRFPVVLQTADQVRALLANEDTAPAPPKHLGDAGLSPIDVAIPGGNFTGALLVGGQAMAPVRAFTAALLRCLPESAPISVSDDGSDKDAVLDVRVDGHQLTEVSEELQPVKDRSPRLWGWVPEIAAALGFKAEWNSETKKVTISRVTPIA